MVERTSAVERGHAAPSERPSHESAPRVRRGAGRCFVYAICGDAHAERANVSLRFLKKFTRSDIVVVRSRTTVSIAHDQVLNVPIDDAFDEHRASLALKTGLHKIFGNQRVVRCYLDSDVIAVNGDIDSIFDQLVGPVAFAEDHCDISEFSRHAVNCGCRGQRCNHLVDAIKDTFGVDIALSGWRHWNAGVFVFDESAIPLLDRWHDFTIRVFKNSYWKVRDQGTLAAAVWDQTLQSCPNLKRSYNRIVDCLDGIPVHLRGNVPIESLAVDRSYDLADKSDAGPAFLHFINGGVMRRGWANWDQVEKLLDSNGQTAVDTCHGDGPSKCVCRQAPSNLSRERTLSADNLIVNSLWIGKRLSKLELLTIHSFLKQGHEFHLWLYEPLDTSLPAEVVVEDANEILPQRSIFTRKRLDADSGVGRNSVGLFSDLFRYKLLYERGGYWTDMDVTCLQPLNFPEAYVLRSHRVGVVGNILKCPRRSELMRETFDAVLREATPNSPWLMSNRVLSQTVERLGLTEFVRDDLCNCDSWSEFIRPFIESDQAVPSTWYAIHWMNEVWRTLESTGGMFRGRLLGPIPSRDDPTPGTTLFRLYEEHGLCGRSMTRIGSSTSTEIDQPAPSPPEPDQPPLVAPLIETPRSQPIAPHLNRHNHVNLLIPSLTIGGAERISVETLTSLSRTGATARLFVSHAVRPSFEVPESPHCEVYNLGGLENSERLQTVALEVLTSPSPVVFTHMIEARELRVLWDYGIYTIPVIHNSQPSWQDPPRSFDHPQVPFVVAVSDFVAEQLRCQGCPRPVITIRHELQRWFSADQLAEDRRAIREQYGIDDETLLIGMVGEFKSQKAYTRAVRVLAEIRREQPAKLMILGGWDHEWGHGRSAYVAACRQAMDSGVIADLLTPGRVRDVERYYAAFDVFLNTSIYEGLSIATLEAIRAGCPIVASDAGGNVESLPNEAIIVREGANIPSYVSAIETALGKEIRDVPPRPHDADLIPRLWSLLAQYAAPQSLPEGSGAASILFLTDNVNVGGAPKSLVNLLSQLATTVRPWLGVMTKSNHRSHLDALATAGVRMFSAISAETYLDRTEYCLHMIRRLGAAVVVFWNLDPRIKLLLAKILFHADIKLIDVSPGALLLDDLDQHGGFQRRIAFTRGQYFDRLDRFVSKYAAGVPSELALAGNKVSVIPNGVPTSQPFDGQSLPLLVPPGADPQFLIGTCCRIVPDKRIEFLIAMMADLETIVPNVHLAIVGGVHSGNTHYWDTIQSYMRRRNVSRVVFAGHQQDVVPFLRQFQVFVMISDRQGCPNASLEAMMEGLPIVANASGGTVDQVQHGTNGFLVSDEDPSDMAERVAFLLMNPSIRRDFGAESRRIAQERFSIDAMATQYLALFDSLTSVPSASDRRTGRAAEVAEDASSLGGSAS
jgi:glycosyltransferase involved in cell wall biosynthesis